jgi:hypothetical protein
VREMGPFHWLEETLKERMNEKQTSNSNLLDLFDQFYLAPVYLLWGCCSRRFGVELPIIRRSNDPFKFVLVIGERHI